MGLKQPTVLDVYRNRPSTAECVEPLKRSAAPDEFVLSEKWQSRVGPVRFPQRDNYCVSAKLPNRFTVRNNSLLQLFDYLPFAKWANYLLGLHLHICLTVICLTVMG